MDANWGNYKTYSVTGLPQQLFGETRLIVTGTSDPDEIGYCECFILSTNLEPHLFYGDCNENKTEFDSWGTNFEFEDYLLMAARSLAKKVLIHEIKKLKASGALNKDQVDKFEFNKCTLPNIVNEFKGTYSTVLLAIAMKTRFNGLRLDLYA